ncbi:hypothetical protein Dsin_029510 [Dipteronia sinensis]|uniref:adenylate dimethylallyltransferase (ADP/ATP-dependent) n=1 Tax=Dipteronia sinensis TaxID=43782 RepID=A0AAD9ZSY4_9ROSI|nr:hypothetical protein Dsin_029510 [Dipteronia sinensis]
MKLSMSCVCRQAVQLPVNFQGSQGNINLEPFFRRKDKVVFVMGATGTGKSRLAIDLATRFSAEIVNSDKIQVFKGLDIVTNKVTEEECKGIPHHLLGVVEPGSNFTAKDFRNHASLAVESIISRDRLPIIAGGSNSYINALVNGVDSDFQLRYECCFLWVDVSLPVLYSFVSERVDRMVQMGLVDEVRQIFDPEADNSRGIRRAIGVPELDQYLRAEGIVDEKTRVKYLEAAIDKIKDNTCKLACRQYQKINKFYNNWIWNWNTHHIDATEVFLKRGHRNADEVWEEVVARSTIKIVRQFLNNEDRVATTINATPLPIAAASR